MFSMPWMASYVPKCSKLRQPQIQNIRQHNQSSRIRISQPRAKDEKRGFVGPLHLLPNRIVLQAYQKGREPTSISWKIWLLIPGWVQNNMQSNLRISFTSYKQTSSGGYVRDIQQMGKNSNPSIPNGIYIFNVFKQVRPNVGVVMYPSEK